MRLINKNINSGKEITKSNLSSTQIHKQFQENIDESRKAHTRDKQYQALNYLIKNTRLLFENNDTAEMYSYDLIELFQVFNSIQKALVANNKITDPNRFNECLKELEALTDYYSSGSFRSFAILIKELLEIKLLSLKDSSSLNIKELHNAFDHFFNFEEYPDLIMEKNVLSIEDINWIYSDYLTLIDQITEIFAGDETIESSINQYFGQYECKIKEFLLDKITKYQDEFIKNSNVENLATFIKHLSEFTGFGYDRLVRPMISTVYWAARKNNIMGELVTYLASYLIEEFQTLPEEEGDRELVEMGSTTIEGNQEFFYSKIRNAGVRDFFIEFLDLNGKTFEHMIARLNNTNPQKHRIGIVFLKLFNKVLSMHGKLSNYEEYSYIDNIKSINDEQTRLNSFIILYTHANYLASYEDLWEIINKTNTTIEDKYIKWLFFLYSKISSELSIRPLTAEIVETANLNLKKVNPNYLDEEQLGRYFKIKEWIDNAKKELKKQDVEQMKNNNQKKINKMKTA